MPSVEINLVNRDINIIKLVDPEVIMYLYKENFLEWDKTIINFLHQFKDYRLSLNKGFSKYNSFREGKNEIDLDNNQVKSDYIPKEIYKEYVFIFTSNSLINVQFILTPYKCSVGDKFNNYLKEYPLNFKQMCIIYKLAKVFNMKHVLQSFFVDLNIHTHPNFDTEFFNSIDNEFFKYLFLQNFDSKREVVKETITNDMGIMKIGFK
jgi:hypothetical protein